MVAPAWPALAAHAGPGPPCRPCGGGAGGRRLHRSLARLRATPALRPPNANPDVNLDIGQTVQVRPVAGRRHACVAYRGSGLDGRMLAAARPSPVNT